MPMRAPRHVHTLVAAGAFLLLAVNAAAQTSAPPDLNGFWINQYTPDLSVVLGKQ